jgi:hypothetical protein
MENHHLGQKINKLIQKFNIFQDDFNCKLDAFIQYLPKLKLVLSKKISVFVARKIAKILSINISELIK